MICLVHPKIYDSGGESDFLKRFQSYSFGNSGPHARFQNRSLPPSRLFDVRWEEELKILLKVKASLAEVSARAVAKADQYYISINPRMEGRMT